MPQNFNRKAPILLQPHENYTCNAIELIMRPTSRSIGENGCMGFFYLLYISLVLLNMFEVDFVFEFYGLTMKVA